MDPTQYYQILARMGQLPQYGQQGPMQQPPQPQMMQQPQAMQQGQLPPMQQGDPNQHHHHGGFSPWMMLSPLGGMFASNPKMGLAMLSPGIGIANLLGAFK
jgi:hypothetical protein